MFNLISSSSNVSLPSPTTFLSFSFSKNDIINRFISENKLDQDKMTQNSKEINLFTVEDFDRLDLVNPCIDKSEYFTYKDAEIAPGIIKKRKVKSYQIIKRVIHLDPLLCFFTCDSTIDQVLKDINIKYNTNDSGQSNKKKIPDEVLLNYPCTRCLCLPKYHRSTSPAINDCLVMKSLKSKNDPEMITSSGYCISCVEFGTLCLIQSHDTKKIEYENPPF